MTINLKSTTVDTPVVGTSTVSPSSDSSISISGAAVLVAIQLELLEIFMKNSKLMNEMASQSNQMALDAAGTASSMVMKAGEAEATMLRYQAATLITQAVVAFAQAGIQMIAMSTVMKQNDKTLSKENDAIDTSIKSINSEDGAVATEAAATTPTEADKTAIRERIKNERLYRVGEDGKVSGDFSKEEIAAIKSDEKLKEHVIGHLEKRKESNHEQAFRNRQQVKETVEVIQKLTEAVGKIIESSFKFLEADKAVEKSGYESLRTFMQSIIDILKSSANQGSETRQDLLTKVQQVLDLLEKLDSTNRFQR